MKGLNTEKTGCEPTVESDVWFLHVHVHVCRVMTRAATVNTKRPVITSQQYMLYIIPIHMLLMCRLTEAPRR